MADEKFWRKFWDDKAAAESDFQATGRSQMDILGFLYTIHECASILELKSADALLDIGSGSGIMALALCSICSHIVALDISLDAVRRARKNVSGASNIVTGLGTIRCLPLKNESFDKVIAYSVLQYLSDEICIKAAFNEINRVMRPGAVGLFAANPDPQSQINYKKSLLSHKNCNQTNEAIGLLNKTLWVSRENLLELAKESGLDAIVLPINPRIQQHTYMFDLMVSKKG